MQKNQPNDPVIDEIREVRRRISEACGHDPEALVAYYMELQKSFSDRLVPALPEDASTDKSAA